MRGRVLSSLNSAIVIFSFLLSFVLRANASLEALKAIDESYDKFSKEKSEETVSLLLGYVFDSSNEIVSMKAAEACSRLASSSCIDKFFEVFKERSEKLKVSHALALLNAFSGSKKIILVYDYLRTLKESQSKINEFRSLYDSTSSKFYISEDKELENKITISLMSDDVLDLEIGLYLCTTLPSSKSIPLIISVLKQRQGEGRLSVETLRKLLTYIRPYDLEDNDFKEILSLDSKEFEGVLLSFLSNRTYKTRYLTDYLNKKLDQEHTQLAALNAIIAQSGYGPEKGYDVSKFPVKKGMGIYLHGASFELREAAYEALSALEKIDSVESIQEELDFLLSSNRPFSMKDVSLLRSIGGGGEQNAIEKKYWEKTKSLKLNDLSEVNRCVLLSREISKSENWEAIKKIFDRMYNERLIALGMCVEYLSRFENPRLNEFVSLVTSWNIPHLHKLSIYRMPLSDIESCDPAKLKTYQEFLSSSADSSMKVVASEIKLMKAQKDPEKFVDIALATAVDDLESFFFERNIDNYDDIVEVLKNKVRDKNIIISHQLEVLMRKFGGRNYILGSQIVPIAPEHQSPVGFWGSLRYPTDYSVTNVDKMLLYLNVPRKEYRFQAASLLLKNLHQFLSKDQIEKSLAEVKAALRDPGLKIQASEALGEISADPSIKKTLSSIAKEAVSKTSKSGNLCHSVCNLAKKVEEMIIQGEEVSSGEFMDNPGTYENAILNMQLSFLMKSKKFCNSELKFQKDFDLALNALLKNDMSVVSQIKTKKIKVWLKETSRIFNEKYVPNVYDGRSSGEIFSRQFMVLLFEELKNNVEYSDTLKDGLVTKLQFVRKQILADLISNESEGVSGSFMNNYAFATSLFHASSNLNVKNKNASDRVVVGIREQLKLLDNKLAVKYSAKSSAFSMESERGASARSVTTYLSLYAQNSELAQKKEDRELLLKSISNYFTKYYEDLTLHVHRDNVHSGADGLAPYYFYSTLPYAVEALNELQEDSMLSQLQQEQVLELKKIAAEKVLGMMREDGLFYQQGGMFPQQTIYTQAERYNNSLGGLALLGLVDTCSSERGDVFYSKRDNGEAAGSNIKKKIH